jgi:hypothetical protein
MPITGKPSVLLKLAQAVSRQLLFSRRPLAASKYSNCRVAAAGTAQRMQLLLLRGEQDESLQLLIAASMTSTARHKRNPSDILQGSSINTK